MLAKTEIPMFKPSFDKEDRDAVAKAVEKGWLSEGSLTKEFEREVAALSNYRFGIACSNGTVALALSMLALGVSPGENVAVPNMTFIATANSVKLIGANPRLADIELDGFNVSWRSARATGSDVIIPVHLNARDAKIPRGEVAIADAAQAMGWLQHLSKATISIVSFHPTKVMTTEEGGMVLTDDEELAEKVRALKDFGRRTKRDDDHPSLGFNFRFGDLRAALGLSQLKKLPGRIARKQDICTQYQVTLPDLALKGKYLNCQDIQYKGRDYLKAKLAEKGIQTRNFYRPLTDYPMYADQRGSQPDSEVASRCGLYLPTWPEMTDEQVQFIIESIKEATR